MKETKKVAISVTLDEPLIERIESISKILRRSRSDTINVLLSEAVEKFAADASGGTGFTFK